MCFSAAASLTGGIDYVCEYSIVFWSSTNYRRFIVGSLTKSGLENSSAYMHLFISDNGGGSLAYVDPVFSIINGEE